MNCKKLMQNIMDVIAEEQIKLGYRSEVIYLYYPLKSLNSLLGTCLLSPSPSPRDKRQARMPSSA